jgi:hypothetical protein
MQSFAHDYNPQKRIHSKYTVFSNLPARMCENISKKS